MASATSEVSQLPDQVGRSWTRFWFTPSDPLTLCVMRILVGLTALWYHASHTTDLVRWFGPHGILSLRTLASFDRGAWRFSLLDLSEAPGYLWLIHGLGFVVLLAMTAGVFTRTSTILSLLLVLSYVHRAPMITAQFEPVLTMMLLYLCIGPAGAYLSVDSLLRRRKATPSNDSAAGEAQHACLNSSWATVAIRLMQVHVAAFYVLIGLTMLNGDTWWVGDAMWWLIARTESRMVNLTFLHRAPFVFNAWTHLVVLVNLTFPLLVWNRSARPIMLVLAALMWGSLALVTGLVSYCAIMFIASLAFVTPETMCRLGRRFQPSKPAAAAN
ncbi:MAG: hypothetical protein RIC55_04360 [Pirellulaceae bacterium]